MKSLTKCKYCGREYYHSSIGPMVELFEPINAWKPRLKTKVHNARESLKCESCGAEVMLNVEIPNPNEVWMTHKGFKIKMHTLNQLYE